MSVLKMEAPDLGFGFRWEPESKNLYIIHVNGSTHEQIASGIETPEAAQLLVTMWCRGYRSKAREITRTPGVKHYHMFAEAGAIGTKGSPL